MEKKNSDEKEIQQLKNRFHDLAEKSFRQGIYTFTGFLGLSDQDLFWQEEKGLKYAGYSLKRRVRGRGAGSGSFRQPGGTGIRNGISDCLYQDCASCAEICG